MNVSNRPGARTLRPGTPRGTGNIADVIALEQTVKRRGRLRRGSTKWSSEDDSDEIRATRERAG